MGIATDQYRESIGRFYSIARTVPKRKRLSLLEILCIHLIYIGGLHAFPYITLFWLLYEDILPTVCFSYMPIDSISQCNAPESSTSFAFILVVLCVLLIMSGIETNPGPHTDSLSESFDSSGLESGSSYSSKIIENGISFLHLNVQSILPKIDIIAAEYTCHDILSFTETWLHPNACTDDDLRIASFKYPPFRRDRPDRRGGGVMVYIKENIYCVHRPDLNVGDLECIWLELKIENKKYLYGTFYIPPASSQQTWDDFELSLELALNTNYSIIVTGDFNMNQLIDHSGDKIGILMSQFSLHQLICDPTYITEHSSSILDLILVDNPQCITYSVVGQPLLNLTRYHLPIIGVLNHSNRPSPPFRRKIFLYDRGDYESYRSKLSETDWDTIFTRDGNDIDAVTSSITSRILEIADETIPHRYIYVRKGDPPWITTAMRKLIRRKNRIHKKAKKFEYRI